jgi:NAD(P)-dependent dehydrogenase (short-subunit alcohol dehydrogenase family)
MPWAASFDLGDQARDHADRPVEDEPLTEGEVLAIAHARASDAYQQTFETNVFGVIEACRAFVPAMARARYGRVVNVSRD